MAAPKKFYVRNALLEGGTAYVKLEEGGAAGTAGTSGTGWTVGTVAANNYSELRGGVKRATGTFSTTAAPDSTAPSTSGGGNAFRSELPYSGTFAAGNWSINLAVIAVTSAASQQGRFQLRVFRSSNSDGTGATEITSGILSTSIVAVTSTATEVVSTFTWNAPAITLTNEYLFFKAAWRITTAGTNANADVLTRYNNTSNIVSTDFQASVTPSVGVFQEFGTTSVVFTETCVFPSAGLITEFQSDPPFVFLDGFVPNGKMYLSGQLPSVELGIDALAISGRINEYGSTPFPLVELGIQVAAIAGRINEYGNTPTVISGVGGLWHVNPSVAGSWTVEPAVSNTWNVTPRAN